MGQAHIGWQRRIGGLVGHVVSHMDEQRAPGLQLVDLLDGLREREMCRVRLEAQRIQHQQVEIAKKRQRRRRDRAGIRDITQAADPEAGDRPGAVLHIKWQHLHHINAERRPIADLDQLQRRPGRAFRPVHKCIAKTLADHS